LCLRFNATVSLKEPITQNLGQAPHLISLGHTESDYPFCTVSRGRESVRQYFWRRRAWLKSQKAIETQPQQYDRTKSSSRFPIPYSVMEFDSHTQDAHLTLHIRMQNGLVIPVRLPRLQLLVLIDRGSTAVASYKIAFSKQVSADDLLECLNGLVTPWRLNDKQLSSYRAGAGFPTAETSHFLNALPDIICLDNAWAHKANRVKQFIMDKLGSVCNLGVPACPKARFLVEAFFKRMAEYEHQLPSTTGSYPTDPIREPRKQAKLPPAVRLVDFENIMDSVIANYNATPRYDLFNKSPLQVLDEYRLSGGQIRYAEGEQLDHDAPFLIRRAFTVRGNIDKGERPHINYAYIKYGGNQLKGRYDLVGKKVYAHKINSKDISSFELFLENGETLCTVRAYGRWGEFPHSLAFRKAVKKATNESIGNHLHKDPVSDYFHNLIKQPLSPNTSLDLLRMSKHIHTDLKDESVQPYTDTPIASMKSRVIGK